MLRISEHRYTAHLRQARHAHADTTVTMVLAGSLRERVGYAEEVARPLSIVVKPRDTEHANEFGGDVRTLQIVVAEHSAAEIEHWDRALRMWRWTHGGPAVASFMRLLSCLRRQADADDLDAAALDVLASLHHAPETKGEPPRWLRVVRQAIEDQSSLRVRDLAKQAGVHPVYLARQFRRWYGCSITDHAKLRRVQRAAHDIASTSKSLSVISHDAGFADHPHMCRTFVRETGVTPTTYRELTG
jgi:AraC family transcriptional regulator